MFAFAMLMFLTYILFRLICFRLDNPEKEEETEVRPLSPVTELRDISERRSLFKKEEHRNGIKLNLYS